MELDDLKAEVIRVRDRLHTLSNDTQRSLAGVQVEVLRAVEKVSDRLESFIAGSGKDPGLKGRVEVAETEIAAIQARENTRDERMFRLTIVTLTAFLAATFAAVKDLIFGRPH